MKLIGRITKDMFDDDLCSEVFVLAEEYYQQFKKMPDNIKINVINNPWKHDKPVIDRMLDIVNVNPTEYNIAHLDEFLADTEIWWKNQQMKLLLKDGVDIIKGRRKFDTGLIHERAKNIDQFCYDENDIFNAHNDDKMVEFYSQENNRIKFNSEHLNEIFNGGMIAESLNIIIAGTHVGKTRLLVNMACDFLRRSKQRRILYISMEQPEEHIASFIDMNFLNMSTQDIKDVAKKSSSAYKNLRAEMRDKVGDIIIKNYSSNVTTAIIRNYVKKLIDVNKRPDCIFLDYLQLIKPIFPSANMFEVGDNVSKEIRAISQEFSIPIWSACQIKVEASKANTKYEGSASNYDITGSKAYSENADCIMNVIENPVMKKNGQQIYSFPKNRHNGIHDYLLFGAITRETYKVDFIGCKKTTDVPDETSEEEADDGIKPSFDFGPKTSF